MRTEKEILRDFNRSGFKIVENNQRWIVLLKTRTDERLFIYKKKKVYSAHFKVSVRVHKLINELYQVWGWL